MAETSSHYQYNMQKKAYKAKFIAELALPFLDWGVVKARPFLKWAGGKTQLLPQIVRYFPKELHTGKIKSYIEPFMGGGAVFFHIAQVYQIDQFFLGDINEELLVAYRTAREDVETLIELLLETQQHYHQLNQEEQKNFFYEMRNTFNTNRASMNFSHYSPAWVQRTAQLIFLNKTCFNGLFRVNSKSGFNVPFGDYKDPTICDAPNLRAASKVLQRAIFQSGDFASWREVVDADSFVYFDPPYRPISKTASFTSYSRLDFDEVAQKRLALFYKELHQRGAKLMLSNSDPKNENPADDFFERAYEQFRIERVKANRMINSNGHKRGEINELLIMNY